MEFNFIQVKELARNRDLLIVEDNIQTRERLMALLSKFFKTVRTAASAEEAIELFDNNTFGSNLLIITDINLGINSGIDLTCHIKKINPKQRVIAISGTQERSVFIASIQCGIDRFLLKPIDNTLLFEALVAVLNKMDYDEELELNRKLLEESKEYAIKLLEEQDQFLKNAIHEIYTPLAVIITNIDLLRMHGIENESLDAIEAGSRIIQNSYEDMTYLMKNDRIKDLKTEIDLVAFITERKRYFSCIAEVNDLNLSMFVGQPNLPTLYMSELKIARLVDNTLSNAIKYSNRPSEISITVGMYKEQLFFEVRNYGPIITDKKKIFQRFHRESKYKGGYGLGLSIVAQICEEENIEIKITSTQIRGTSFRYIFNNATQLQQNLPTITAKNE